VDASVDEASGRLVRVSPRPDRAGVKVSCPRGRRAVETVYSPERLLHPTLRSPGEDTPDERVSWEQAYEFMTGQLRRVAAEHGPEAVCIYTGRGNFEYSLNELFSPAATSESSANAVLFPFGSPNTTGVGAICYTAQAMIASRACFGEDRRELCPDLENAELALLWGANPASAGPPRVLRRLLAARRRGVQMVSIDHRRSETARATRARWIRIRPGTDGALALGLINQIIQAAAHDQEFVQRWTHGFEELRAYAAGFTPDRVTEITGVGPTDQEWLARTLARASGCALISYSGLEYSNSGVQALRALWCLQALTGNIDAAGGTVVLPRDRPRLSRLLTEPPAGGRPPIGADEYPLYRAVRNEAHAALLPRAILEGEPYEVRALIISGASITTAWPNPGLWQRALAALDLLVVVDRFPSADARHAHLLLPATTGFENLSYFRTDDGRVLLRRPVISPRGEARNDYLIFAELARRLGYGHRWPADEEAAVRYALEGSGVTFEELARSPDGVQLELPPLRAGQHRRSELRTDGEPGFETPTGKFEFTSEWLREHGHEPLPVYTDPAEGPARQPELVARFPLVFSSGARRPHTFRSQLLDTPSFTRRDPHPRAQMNQEDAGARGISDGDPVWVATPRGRLPFRAWVTEDISAGVVEVDMGGGGPLAPEAWRKANVNELTDLENRDPISGFPVLKALLCEVERRTGE